MKNQILFRYLFRKAIFTVLLVFGSLGGLLLILGIADETGRRVSGNYTAIDALQYKILTLPYELYEFTPLLIVLSALITFATLNKNSELVIIKQMTSNGLLLILKLFLPIIVIAAPLFWMGEWLAPTWSNNATATRALLRGRELPAQEQQWIKSGNWFISTAFVDQSDGSLVSPTLYRFDNNGLFSITEAQLAQAKADHWVLPDATEKDMQADSERHIVDHALLSFSTPTLTPDIAQQLATNSSTLTLSQLSQRVFYAKKEDSLRSSEALEWWQRVLFPIEILLMLNLALIFSLTSFRQKTIGDVVFKGLATALALSTLLDVSSGVLAISGLPVLAAAILPLLTITALSQYYSFKRL
ncbi:LptF/LptG family permease [Reinekea sp.]|jgi:lipopolysaccharide export system permease protein|uniref:LptF/LptG family permease n=1 Tax=Reinekea sp. TaxID=1970455 RepID=UPI003988C551